MDEIKAAIANTSFDDRVKGAIGNTNLEVVRAAFVELITIWQAREGHDCEIIDRSYWRNERAVRIYEKYGESSCNASVEHRKIEGESFDAWQKMGKVTEEMVRENRRRLQEL